QWITNSQIAWSRWSSLGGYFKAGIAVGQHGNGGLELFGVNETNTSLFRCYQSNPADPASWTAWEDIGGTVRPCPAIGRNADGSLEVFANDSEHASLLNYRREISNNSGWLDWVNMDQPN